MSTQTETQDAEVSTDGPLLDLTDAGVKKFIKQAKARGYVTMEELNKVLPSEEVTPDAIEDTYETARAGLVELNEKSLDAAKVNSDAVYGFAKSLLAVKTFADGSAGGLTAAFFEPYLASAGGGTRVAR